MEIGNIQGLMMKIKDIIILVLIFTICILLIKYNGYKADDEPNGQITTSENYKEIEKIKYVYQTQYIDLDFVSIEDKLEWKDELIYLLSNQKISICDEKGGVLEYEYLYSDRPCVENGYQLALLDINTDGTPELFVNVGGGSAGNAFYYVYDIISGQEIGTLDGGHSNSWCIYFNQLTGKYEAIGQFEWRSGWMGKMRIVDKAMIVNTLEKNEKYIYETNWMFAYYDINAVAKDLNEEEIENGIDSSWEEIYTGVHFSVNGNNATIEEYFAEQDSFVENYIRITETAIQLIDWDDITDKDDDIATKAEKMAEALVSSDQQFIKPTR